MNMKALRTDKWLALLAALLLLMGTAAPALVRMSCLSGGHTVLSFGQADDCCPEEEQAPEGAQFHAVCCDVERTAPNHDAFNVESGPSVAAAIAYPVFARIDAFSPLHVPLRGYGLSTRPPPLLIGERLSQVGCFLI